MWGRNTLWPSWLDAVCVKLKGKVVLSQIHFFVIPVPSSVHTYYFGQLWCYDWQWRRWLCLYLSSHGACIRDADRSHEFFAGSKSLRIAGSCCQRRDLHCCTWYSNSGEVAKKVNYYILLHTCIRIQNWWAFQSDKFFATAHRLVVLITSRWIFNCNLNVFNP